MGAGVGLGLKRLYDEVTGNTDSTDMLNAMGNLKDMFMETIGFGSEDEADMGRHVKGDSVRKIFGKFIHNPSLEYIESYHTHIDYLPFEDNMRITLMMISSEKGVNLRASCQITKDIKFGGFNHKWIFYTDSVDPTYFKGLVSAVREEYRKINGR